ncbi:MAG TPA: choice-of-anchor P family protein, partial [Acidimicrobiia bacterium]|nr:choice-of-anchor P family protein [Acidimicrobiia bacterium]
MKHRLGPLAVVVALLLAGVGPMVDRAQADPGDGSSYGVDVNLLGIDAGPLVRSSTAGPTTGSVASVLLQPVLTTGVIGTSATFVRGTGTTDADASVADVHLEVAPPDPSHLLSTTLLALTADAVTSSCTATPASTTGHSVLTGLNVLLLGVPVSVAANAAPNTTVNLGIPLPLLGTVAVARLVLNEQVTNPDGSLTVNALHLTTLAVPSLGLTAGDVVIASTTCGPAGPSNGITDLLSDAGQVRDPVPVGTAEPYTLELVKLDATRPVGRYTFTHDYTVPPGVTFVGAPTAGPGTTCSYTSSTAMTCTTLLDGSTLPDGSTPVVAVTPTIV